jgi:hypothetical protein
VYHNTENRNDGSELRNKQWKGMSNHKKDNDN